MSKVRVNLTLDKDIVSEWEKVAKLYRTSRSAMVEEFLKEVLPIMLETDPNIIIKKGVHKIAESLNEIGDSIESK